MLNIISKYLLHDLTCNIIDDPTIYHIIGVDFYHEDETVLLYDESTKSENWVDFEDIILILHHPRKIFEQFENIIFGVSETVKIKLSVTEKKIIRSAIESDEPIADFISNELAYKLIKHKVNIFNIECIDLTNQNTPSNINTRKRLLRDNSFQLNYLVEYMPHNVRLKTKLYSVVRGFAFNTGIEVTDVQASFGTCGVTYKVTEIPKFLLRKIETVFDEFIHEDEIVKLKFTKTEIALIKNAISEHKSITECISYRKTQELIKHHFDVFNMIDFDFALNYEEMYSPYNRHYIQIKECMVNNTKFNQRDLPEFLVKFINEIAFHCNYIKFVSESEYGFEFQVAMTEEFYAHVRVDLKNSIIDRDEILWDLGFPVVKGKIPSKIKLDWYRKYGGSKLHKNNDSTKFAVINNELFLTL